MAIAEIQSFVLDQLDAAVIVTDLDGVITHWNRGAEALYGWMQAEAVGRDVVELLVPTSNPEAAGRIMEVLVSGKRWEGEFEVLRKDGSAVFVRVRDSLLYDKAGMPVGIVGLSIDVTEQWRAERRLAVQYGVAGALAEAETLEEGVRKVLQAICESVGWHLGALWTVDQRAGVLRCVDVWTSEPAHTEEFEHATRARTFPAGVGLPGRVWQGARPAWIPDVVQDDNFPRAAVAAEVGLHGAFGFPILLRGQILGVIEAFSPRIEKPDEDLIQMMEAIGSQVGQFIERKDAEADLRANEARRRAILEASLDCIVAMNHEGRITEFNPAAERTFGYSREEAIGQPLADLLIPPSLRDRHRAGLAKYLATGEGPILGHRIELTAMRRDGSEFPVELAITRVDLPGAPLFKGAIRDITQTKRAEEERNHLLDAERSAREEAEEARRRLAFQVEANSLLASPLDFAGALEALGRLAVTLLADICLIDIVHDDGNLRRMVAAHADPANQELTNQLKGRYAPKPGGPHPAAKVIRTGEPEYSPVMTAGFLRRTTRDEEHFHLTQALGFESYICVPLIARGRILGTITLVSTDPGHRYGPNDVAVAEDLARRTALTVDNARLYEAEQRAREAAERAAERTAVLQSVTAALAEALVPEDVADVIVERSMQVLEARAGAVALTSDDGSFLRLVRWHGYEDERVEPFSTFSVDAALPMADAVRTGSPVVVTTTEELLARYPTLPERLPGNQALVCVPLTVEGRPIGGMSLSFGDARSFAPDDLGLLLAIGRQGAQAIQRARAYDAERAARAEAEAAERRLSFLANASTLLARGLLDYEETLRNVARLAVPEFADWCVVDLLTDGGAIERVAVAHADPAKQELALELRERYPPDPKAAAGVANVLRTGQAELYPEITDELLDRSGADPQVVKVARELGLRSSMTVPMVGRARTLGAITFVTAESGYRYGPADLVLAEELAGRAALAVDNARLYQERSYVARTLQQALLPPRLPNIPGVEIGALYRPSGEGAEIGGDFYDLFETADGTWAMVIGDVCGKGADAAAFIGLVRHTVRAVAMQEQRPSVILGHLNEALRQQTIGERFCTVAYGRLRTGEAGARLTVCCGGHPLPLILRQDGSVEGVGQPGTLLGVFPDPELLDRVADLGPGDTVLVYTDGVTEERSGSEVFGEEGLRTVLASCAGLDAQAVVRAVGEAIEAFRPETPRDDMAILALRVKS